MVSARIFKGIRGQLLLLVAIPVAMLGILYYQAGQSIGILMASVDKANLVRGPAATYTGAFEKDSESLQRHILSARVAETEAQRQEELAKAEEDIKNFESAAASYEKLPHSGATAHIYEKIEQSWKETRLHAEKTISEIKSNNLSEAEVIYRQSFKSATRELEKYLTELSTVRMKLMKEEAIKDAQLMTQTKWALDILGFVGLAVVLAFSARLIWKLNSSLSFAVNELALASNGISAASKELHATSEQVAQGSTEAAASIEETVASLEEVNSAVHNNSAHGKKTATLTEEAVQKADRGEQELEKLSQVMSGIQASSMQIQEIIGVIDEIAFQTNLLSLNATIEAARAGEHGRGFSAVAESVRELSHKSAEAAKQISDLIRKSSEQVQNGVDTAAQSSRVFSEISNSIRQVSEMSHEIAHASQEQALGVGQINKAMNHLDTSTQMNSAASEEVAVSAEELTKQALGLLDVVDKLEVILNGQKKKEAVNLVHPSKEVLGGRVWKAA